MLAHRVSAAFLLVLVSCQVAPVSPTCGRAAHCLASRPGVVIGRDRAARLAATRELHSAAISYSSWFPGETASSGLVMLDSAAAGQAGLVRGTSWTLTYDLASKGAMEDDLAVAKSGRAGAGTADFRAIGLGDAEFDVTRPGVLAHEICHRHAARAFARAWGRSALLPDMLDEVSAISCESEALRAARVDRFAELFSDGKVIPWDGFLLTGHPLKSDPAIVQALNRLGEPGQAAVAFDIEAGSSYEGKIALFYAQAAAFGEFVRTHSCRGRQAIGALLSTYDPRGGLDSWLRDHGRSLCLPNDSSALAKAFSEFIGRGRASPPATRAVRDSGGAADQAVVR